MKKIFWAVPGILLIIIIVLLLTGKNNANQGIIYDYKGYQPNGNLNLAGFDSQFKSYYADFKDAPLQKLRLYLRVRWRIYNKTNEDILPKGKLAPLIEKYRKDLKGKEDYFDIPRILFFTNGFTNESAMFWIKEFGLMETEDFNLAVAKAEGASVAFSFFGYTNISSSRGLLGKDYETIYANLCKFNNVSLELQNSLAYIRNRNFCEISITDEEYKVISGITSMHYRDQSQINTVDSILILMPLRN